MIYVGIVESIKDEHLSGLYGRKKVSKTVEKKLEKDISFKDLIVILNQIPMMSSFGTAGVLIYKIIEWRLKELKLVASIKTDDKIKKIIIHNEILANNYRVNDEILYGLFDNFKVKSSVFKKIMRSGGGSTL